MVEKYTPSTSKEIKENQKDNEDKICKILEINIEYFSLIVDYIDFFDLSNLCLVCRTMFHELLPQTIKRIEIFYEDCYHTEEKQLEKQLEKQFEQQFKPYWTPIFNCIMSFNNNDSYIGTNYGRGVENFIIQVPDVDYNSKFKQFILYDFLHKDIITLIKHDKLKYCRQFRVIFNSIYDNSDFKEIDEELFESTSLTLKLVIEEAIVNDKFSYLEDFAFHHYSPLYTHPLLPQGIDTILTHCPRVSIVNGDYLSFRMGVLALMSFAKEVQTHGEHSWIFQRGALSVCKDYDLKLRMNKSDLPGLIFPEEVRQLYESGMWEIQDSYPLITELNFGKIYKCMFEICLENSESDLVEGLGETCLNRILQHFFTSARFPSIKTITISAIDQYSFYVLLEHLLYDDMLLRKENFFDFLAQTEHLIIDFIDCKSINATRQAADKWGRKGVPPLWWYDEWHADESDITDSDLLQLIKSVYERSELLKEEIKRNWDPGLPYRYAFLKERNTRQMSICKPIVLFPCVKTLTVKNSMVNLESLLRIVRCDSRLNTSKEGEGLHLYLQTYCNMQSGFRGFREFLVRNFNPELHAPIATITICDDTAGGVYRNGPPFGGFYPSDVHQISVCDATWKHTDKGQSLADPNNYNDSLRSRIDVGHLCLAFHKSLTESNILHNIQQLTLPWTEAIHFVGMIMLWLDECFELSNSVTIYDKPLFEVVKTQPLRYFPNIFWRMMTRYINAENYVDIPGLHLNLMNNFVIDFSEYRTATNDVKSSWHKREKVIIDESEFHFYIVAMILSGINLARSGVPHVNLPLESLKVIHFSCRTSTEYNKIYTWLQRPIDMVEITAIKGKEKEACKEHVSNFFRLFTQESTDKFPRLRLERKGMIIQEYSIKEERRSDGVYQLRFKYECEK